MCIAPYFSLNGKVLIGLFLIQRKYLTCKDVLYYPINPQLEAAAHIYQRDLLWKIKRRGREIQGMGRRVGMGRERKRGHCKEYNPLRLPGYMGHWALGFIKNVQCTQASFFFFPFDLKGKNDLPGRKTWELTSQADTWIASQVFYEMEGFLSCHGIPATKKSQVLMDTSAEAGDHPFLYIQLFFRHCLVLPKE